MRASRRKLAQARGRVVDVQDAVVQIENLSAAIQLPPDGVADQPLVVGGDDGFDGQPVLRRRFDGAHVARAGQGEVKRARNGRGRQRQDIDQRAQLFEPFLVQDAEALLFVDDDQAQILEYNVALQEAMGADDDVHRAGRQVPDHAGLLAPGAKAREQFDADRIIGHALAEGVEMLLGQHGGRHQHRRPVCLPCAALKAARMATSVLP